MAALTKKTVSKVISGGNAEKRSGIKILKI